MLYAAMVRFMIRIEKELHDDLVEIAAESYEGNLSMVARKALREFRDRLHRHAESQKRADPGRSADPTL